MTTYIAPAGVATLMAKQYRPVLVALATAVFALGAFAAASVGHHSVSYPRWWWDQDNDGLVDANDGNVTYCYASTGWTDTAKGRASEAAATWRNGSSWDPTIGSAGCGHDLRKDGSTPPGETWASLDYALAVNNVQGTTRNPGTPTVFVDINDSDIYVNWNQYPWNYATSCSGSACNTTISFRGVLTHEIGHGISSIDLYGDGPCDTGSQVNTMCGEPTVLETWYLDDLTTDDVGSADDVY